MCFYDKKAKSLCDKINWSDLEASKPAKKEFRMWFIDFDDGSRKCYNLESKFGEARDTSLTKKYEIPEWRYILGKEGTPVSAPQRKRRKN